MNTIDELITVLEGVKAGRKWGYINHITGILTKTHDQKIESLKGVMIAHRIGLMPKTFTCSGIEISAPLRVAPALNSIYWIASAAASSFCTHGIWQDDSDDKSRFDRGIVHAEKAAAAAHGRAMCGVRE